MLVHTNIEEVGTETSAITRAHTTACVRCLLSLPWNLQPATPHFYNLSLSDIFRNEGAGSIHTENLLTLHTAIYFLMYHATNTIKRHRMTGIH